ncbi:MAG: GYF domain-containing protein [Verrucomicrobiota bacterium]
MKFYYVNALNNEIGPFMIHEAAGLIRRNELAEDTRVRFEGDSDFYDLRDTALHEYWLKFGQKHDLGSETRYFYRKNGDSYGPHTVERIAEAYRSNIINKDTPVSEEGDQNWRSLGEFDFMKKVEASIAAKTKALSDHTQPGFTPTLPGTLEPAPPPRVTGRFGERCEHKETIIEKRHKRHWILVFIGYICMVNMVIDGILTVVGLIWVLLVSSVVFELRNEELSARLEERDIPTVVVKKVMEGDPITEEDFELLDLSQASWLRNTLENQGIIDAILLVSGATAWLYVACFALGTVIGFALFRAFTVYHEVRVCFRCRTTLPMDFQPAR